MDLTGSVIVASPNLSKHSDFAKTVIYIVRHESTAGAIGLIVNHTFNQLEKPLHIKHNKTYLQLKDFAIYYGGPVSTEKGFILHLDKTAKIKDNFAIRISSNIKLLKSLITGTNKTHGMFVFGYCSWDANQLEKEIANDKWIVLNKIPAGIILNTHNEAKWDAALSTMQIMPLFYNNTLGRC